jgi:hypothetical protein
MSAYTSGILADERRPPICRFGHHFVSEHPSGHNPVSAASTPSPLNKSAPAESAAASRVDAMT